MEKSNKLISQIASFFIVLLVSISYSYLAYAQPKKAINSLNDFVSGINEKIDKFSAEKMSQGEKGSDGIDGSNGKDGENGSDGTNGLSGTNGANGTNGTDGTNGINGINGQNGSTGIQGEKGDNGPRGLAGDTEELGSITSAAITYYVSPSGSDENGDGTVGLPFATIQHAIDSLPDFLAHECNIILAAGTYRESVVINKNSVNATNYLYITGNTSSPNSYIISGADSASPTEAVRDYGITLYGDAAYYLRGIRLDYFKKAGLFMENGSRSRIQNINFNYCAQDNLYGAIRQSSYTYLDIRGAINITGNGGNNESGFYSADGPSYMYNYGTFAINIYKVKYGVYSSSTSQWIGDNTVQWTVDNSAIDKIAGSAGVYFGAGDHGHDFELDVNNFTYGVYLDNLSLFDVNVGNTYTNVDTSVSANNGSLSV
ncbi:MAG: Collagen triple helix repeat (20 copies) [candidate division WS2 bacterium ADurb.Bin280]|uniref:Collagen triple helix repeat (20 copies) n=1 Tax=candidate division WS2 bacterium ADurb.Bin280 TaxID=1852829 RepID=A0A1V5SFB0_9BACT|nr:MAG: Collagen triple helix repeat (20 copies) [candidate division WS2 bacterium ADurb.Bin280]